MERPHELIRRLSSELEKYRNVEDRELRIGVFKALGVAFLAQAIEDLGSNLGELTEAVKDKGTDLEGAVDHVASSIDGMGTEIGRLNLER